MKIVTLIARILLGLTFTVFGLNGFFQFLHMPMPTGLAGQYMGAIFMSHYAWMVFAFQLIGGVLLLVNRFVPLALTILAGVIINIVTFHVAMAPEGLPMALISTALWFVVFYNVRSSFAPIFSARGTT